MFVKETTRRRLTALAVLAALVLVALMLAPSNSPGAATPSQHVVAPGETLWSIAGEHYGGDPREHVSAIADANDLEGATIWVGQELALP